MRIRVAALCAAAAFAAPAFAQTSTKPPRAPEAQRSICAGLMPRGDAVAGANDPFAGLSRREIEARLLREGPRRARGLELEALTRCLVAEMGSRD